MESIQPSELAARLKRGDKLVLLDVRNHDELAICCLPNIVHVPLGDLDQGRHGLDPADVIVCICHHGRRSARAGMILESYGFDQVINLTGGMELWAQEMDPKMARY